MNRALYALFTSIISERFAFYQFLCLYSLYQISLGVPERVSTRTVAGIISSVYGATFLGGLLGQRLGFRWVALAGAMLVAAAYSALALGAPPLAWGAALAAGIGCYKPCMPILVSLASDCHKAMPRFYACVNVGGFLGPLIGGLFAAAGMFHPAFAVSAAAALVAGAALSAGWGELSRADEEFRIRQALAVDVAEGAERGRWAAIVAMCLVSVCFWTPYQAFFGLVEHIIETGVDRRILGAVMPTAWFNAENGLIILLAGALAAGAFREWSALRRFLGALLLTGLSFLLMVVGGWKGGKMHLLFPAVAVFVETVGEIMLSPLGLSKIARVAPARHVGLCAALWYLSMSAGGWLSGLSSSLWYFVAFSAGGLVLLACSRRQFRLLDDLSR